MLAINVPGVFDVCEFTFKALCRLWLKRHGAEHKGQPAIEMAEGQEMEFKKDDEVYVFLSAPAEPREGAKEEEILFVAVMVNHPFATVAF